MLLVKSPAAAMASVTEDGDSGEDAAVVGSNHVKRIQNPSEPMIVVSFCVNRNDCTAIGIIIKKVPARKCARKIGENKKHVLKHSCEKCGFNKGASSSSN